MKKKITIITFLLAVCALVWMPGIQAQAKEPVIVVIDPGHGGEENRGGGSASSLCGEKSDAPGGAGHEADTGTV